MSELDPRIERLHDLADGRLDAAEAERVRDEISSDPELARRFAEIESVKAALSDLAADRASSRFTSRVMHAIANDARAHAAAARAPLDRRRVWLARVAALAACIVFCVFAIEQVMVHSGRPAPASDLSANAPPPRNEVSEEKGEGGEGGVEIASESARAPAPAVTAAPTAPGASPPTEAKDADGRADAAAPALKSEMQLTLGGTLSDALDALAGPLTKARAQESPTVGAPPRAGRGAPKTAPPAPPAPVVIRIRPRPLAERAGSAPFDAAAFVRGLEGKSVAADSFYRGVDAALRDRAEAVRRQAGTSARLIEMTGANRDALRTRASAAGRVVEELVLGPGARWAALAPASAADSAGRRCLVVAEP